MSLEILKYCSIAVGTASGLYGTLTEKRDKLTGRLTQWGKHTVALIVVSGVVAITTQSVESYRKAKVDAEDARARREASIRLSLILGQAEKLKEQLETQNNELNTQSKSLGKAVEGIGTTAQKLATINSSQNHLLNDTYAMLHPLGKLHMACSISNPFSGSVILESHWYQTVISPDESDRYPEWGPAEDDEHDSSLYKMLHWRLSVYFNRLPRHANSGGTYIQSESDLSFRSEQVDSSISLPEGYPSVFINNVSANMPRVADNRKIIMWEDLYNSELVIPLPVAYSEEATIKSCRFVFGGGSDAEYSRSMQIEFTPNQRQFNADKDVYYVVQLSKDALADSQPTRPTAPHIDRPTMPHIDRPTAPPS
jgi:hypothetical protein